MTRSTAHADFKLVYIFLSMIVIFEMLDVFCLIVEL